MTELPPDYTIELSLKRIWAPVPRPAHRDAYEEVSTWALLCDGLELNRYMDRSMAVRMAWWDHDLRVKVGLE